MAKTLHDELESKMNKALAIKDGEPGKKADITAAVNVLQELVN